MVHTHLLVLSPCPRPFALLLELQAALLLELQVALLRLRAALLNPNPALLPAAVPSIAALLGSLGRAALASSTAAAAARALPRPDSVAIDPGFSVAFRPPAPAGRSRCRGRELATAEGGGGGPGGPFW